MAADKKIELQDIEDDNLQSEKRKEYETEPRYQNSGLDSVAVSDYLKNGVYNYFSKPAHPSPKMYAVTETPEPPPPPPVHPSIQAKLGFTQPTPPQQPMVGYLSNVPMQIYLVPQYYNEAEQGANTLAAVQYTTGSQYTTGNQYTAPQQATHGVARVAGYQTAPEAVQTQTNYVEVPAYVVPTAKTYVPQYSQPPVTYVSYTPPAGAAVPTGAPVVTYQVQYPSAVIAPQQGSKVYYQNTHYQDTNAIEEHESVDESPKQYTQTEVSYSKPPVSDYPRFYSARPPPREEYHRHNQIQELPHPSPLLLKPHPPHLAHIPKALPFYKPLHKPVYTGHPPPGILAARPSEHFPTYKRRPTSLLDSYVPSRLQIEYMKRGFTNDPLQAYEDLSSGHFSHATSPRHFERGFLPNQMYHTASGGVTFGHYKRSPKLDKVKKN